MKDKMHLMRGAAGGAGAAVAGPPDYGNLFSKVLPGGQVFYNTCPPGTLHLIKVDYLQRDLIQMFLNESLLRLSRCLHQESFLMGPR